MTIVQLSQTEQLEAFYAVGKLLYDQGAIRRAAEIFRYVLSVDARRANAWLALGACHEQLDDLEIAASLYEFGFRVSGHDPELGLLGARARAAVGDLTEAAELLEAVAELGLDEQQRERLAAVRATMQRTWR